jgi:hypothetical protein
MYGSLEYANQKLRRTVVMHKGLSVLVLDVVGDNDNITLITETRTCERIEAPIEEFDIRGFKLGYANNADGCVYLSRVPMRSDWRQGLRERNVLMSGGRYRRTSAPSISRIMESLETKYPSMVDAFKDVSSGKAAAVAFSPAFCFKRTKSGVSLCYRNFRKVGEVSTDGSYKLSDKFSFLDLFLKKLEQGAA